MIEAAGTSKQIKRIDLTLADKILVLDELKNKTLKQTMSMKKALPTQLLWLHQKIKKCYTHLL